MQSLEGVGLAEVREVYSGAEGALWELLMGQQIHVGGMLSSLDLADRAGLRKGMHGVDLCCCNGAGMRLLVRLLGVASMRGVDATLRVVELGRRRCREEGLDDRIEIRLGDACETGLPSASADFVWGEDAWCYVERKDRLVAEAARLVRPGGVVAFTDWVEGPAGLSAREADRFLRFMKFPSLESLDGYPRLLEDAGCRVTEASDSGRLARHLALYADMARLQLTYDALRLLDFDAPALARIDGEMDFLLRLAREGKVCQGRFVARRA